MKCPSANRFLVSFGSILLLTAAFCVQAKIENTIVAHYDLDTGKSTHYEVMSDKKDQQNKLTLIPIGAESNTLSTFRITSCTWRKTGTASQGYFHFEAARPDKNDTRMANLSAFVNDHNLRAWWIRLDNQQNLIFDQDVGRLVMSDPDQLLLSTTPCRFD